MYSASIVLGAFPNTSSIFPTSSHTLLGFPFSASFKAGMASTCPNSLLASSPESPQRAETYLKLANLYYETESFVLAKAYYDSTISVLSAKDERYQQASLYAKNLTEIARLITSINDNDSIVRVYNMSEAERADLAKKIKKQREADASKKAAAEQDKKALAQNAGKSARPDLAADRLQEVRHQDREGVTT